MYPQHESLPQATAVKNSLPKLVHLYGQYEKSSIELSRIAAEAEKFTIRVPLVGAFSSGKTTLVNALIGEKLFAVEVNPETALPVELTYAPKTQFIGYTPDGQTQNLSHEAVRAQQFSSLLPDGWLEARLPAGHLQAISQLTLVDMPGWDSGIDQHSRAIDSYLYRSLAYCLVVSADEGNLRDSLRAFVSELAVRKMPAIVVITKSDKKPQEDVDAVQKQVTLEVTKILGQPPLGIVQISARKNQIQSFVELLLSLQTRVGERYSAAIVTPLLRDMTGLQKRLETLANQENLNEEQLNAQRKVLETEMQQFADRVQMETQSLDAQLGPAASKIIHRIESSLLSQVESLAAQAINGADIKGPIGTTVRLAVSEGIQEEFAPKLQRYFDRIEQDLPEVLSIDTTLDLSGGDLEKTDSLKINTSGIQQVITSILSLIFTKITGPIGLVVGGIISLFVSLFGGASSKEDPAAKAEGVKNQIINKVIPDVKNQIDLTLRQQLKKQIEEAKEQIIAATELQNQQHKQTLDQLEEELKKGHEEFEKMRSKYLADLQELETIKTDLSEVIIS